MSHRRRAAGAGGDRCLLRPPRLGPARGLLIGAALAAAGCSFPDLVPAEVADPGGDDLPDSVTIGGFQVAPSVIHPGDLVTVRDPRLPEDGERVPLYAWDACSGVVSPPPLDPTGREVRWEAPPQAGWYDVTVNRSNVEWPEPSVVLPLCVAAPGQDACPADDREIPALLAVLATPDLQAQAECDGGCEADVEAVLDDEGPAASFRWLARQGDLLGSGASATWRLPTVGCCTEVFTATVTACAQDASAATGQVDVTVTPD